MLFCFNSGEVCLYSESWKTIIAKASAYDLYLQHCQLKCRILVQVDCVFLLEGNALALAVSVVVSMLFTSLVKVFPISSIMWGFSGWGLCVVLFSCCWSSFHMVQPSGAASVKVKTGQITSRSKRASPQLLFLPFEIITLLSIVLALFLSLLFYCLSQCLHFSHILEIQEN